MTGLSAEPQPCNGCEREGLKCNTDEGREGTPASSNRMPTSAWVRKVRSERLCQVRRYKQEPCRRHVLVIALACCMMVVRLYACIAS